MANTATCVKFMACFSSSLKRRLILSDDRQKFMPEVEELHVKHQQEDIEHYDEMIAHKDRVNEQRARIIEEKRKSWAM